MAKIKIEDYGIWYEEETDLIYDDDGKLRCTIPKGTFYFEKKLYTYGTIVKKTNKNSYSKNVYTAIFQKDTEQKKIRGGFNIVSIKEAQEYYDGKSFELDEIFLEINGKTKEYLNTRDFDNGIIEIVKPVYYEVKANKTAEIEFPPTDVGYRTIIGNDFVNPPNKIFKDHLYNCNVDYLGNVIDWFEPLTFGYEKCIYSIGTKVILKKHTYFGNHYYVAVFDGNSFIIEGYPQVNYDGPNGKSSAISTSFLKRGTSRTGGLSICKIIEPHYYRPVPKKTTPFERFKISGEHNRPIDTTFGTILYIVIMVVGTIFKARWIIYIVATLIFVLWRFGHLNKK